MNSARRGQRESCAVLWQRAIENALQRETGLRGELASLLSARILAGLRYELGGEQLYMPLPSKAARNASIRQQFTGGELGFQRVAWAGLSRTHIYRICKQGEAGDARR